MCFVPRNGASESLLKTDLCSKPEFLFGASRVELPPRLPVGLRRIPFHLALEARQSGDQAHKVSNAYFKRRAEIHWQQENGPESVLLSVRLALYEEHLLGKPVGRVRLLWVSVPEVVLPKGNRRQLRIGTHSPDGDKLLDAALTGYLHELCAHHQVVVEELARSFSIGSNASHHGSEMYEDV